MRYEQAGIGLLWGVDGLWALEDHPQAGYLREIEVQSGEVLTWEEVRVAGSEAHHLQALCLLWKKIRRGTIALP